MKLRRNFFFSTWAFRNSYVEIQMSVVLTAESFLDFSKSQHVSSVRPYRSGLQRLMSEIVVLT